MSTNLDAQRPVIWDLGAIAASGAPNAQQVFRDAVLASAAIPAAFSPVMVTVEANGQSWQELHVDGGVIGQVALADGWQRALLASPAQALAPERVYLIVNNRIGPEQDETTARILPIATRANSTMIKYQLRNDLLRAFLIADRRGVDIQATWIGEGFPDPYVGPFDPDHLAALYDYGYRKTIEGRAWQTTLPF